MILHRTIRPFLAGIMLALFALCVTPKVVIHALVAHHKDTHLSPDHGKADQFNKAGFHCAIDNLVVESPFLGHAISVTPEMRAPFQIFPRAFLDAPLSFTQFIFRLRGPPAGSIA